ncbi:DUF262 domain-containing protein [Chitinophaga agrisoli]|uniref:DUF262 domain-containing protein n=1 Tax=Chitinophaga agrisoli TaxID=2607653 RepID=A0A5B2VQD4_9BACT|nr:DUF262 domain-containing protein [Chitinophaga agrisoli]KAA2240319.1 DUF262 domain-containing protein [Chitinophaga agrisoli]
MSEIVDRFQEAQRSLVLQSSDLSLGSIAEMVDSGAIDLSPGYQRRERWTPAKESALIESFLLNIPVPPIYLAEDTYGKYSVIDGKQRVTAIHKFIRLGTVLQSLEKFQELEGLSYTDLPQTLSNALTIRPYLRVVTLLNQSDPELKYQVFTRLNTGGDKLLPQEIRNVAFMGPLNDLILELARHPFLRRQLKIITENEKAYKEMTDAEYVLRFFTIREYWENFQGNINVAMNRFMHTHRHSSPDQIATLRAIFERTIDLCATVWEDNAFQRSDGEEHRRQIIQGFFDVQMVPLSIMLERNIDVTQDQIIQIRQQFLELYNTDEVFQDSIRQFTSNPVRVHYRINTMLQLLNQIL